MKTATYSTGENSHTSTEVTNERKAGSMPFLQKKTENKKIVIMFCGLPLNFVCNKHIIQGRQFAIQNYYFPYHSDREAQVKVATALTGRIAVVGSFSVPSNQHLCRLDCA